VIYSRKQDYVSLMLTTLRCVQQRPCPHPAAPSHTNAGGRAATPTHGLAPPVPPRTQTRGVHATTPACDLGQAGTVKMNPHPHPQCPPFAQMWATTPARGLPPPAPPRTNVGVHPTTPTRGPPPSAPSHANAGVCATGPACDPTPDAPSHTSAAGLSHVPPRVCV
jgi:hypothetical protein